MSFKKYIKRGIHYILKGIPNQHVTANIVTLSSSELLQGRNAIVTGGTSGIGKAIAESFVRAGATVIITGRDIERVRKTVSTISSSLCTSNVMGVQLNNTEIESFTCKIDEIVEMLPNNRIDILVNNAGVNGGNFNYCSEEEFTKVMDTNLKGVFFLTRIVANHMIDKGVKGNILNIASSSSLRPATSAYMLSKWGLRGFTSGLAKTLIKHDIVVNGLAPGPTATPMLVKNGTDNISIPNNPSGRYMLPEEIANMAVVLTSGMGRMIVGDIVYMTGGAGITTFDDINY